MTGTTVIAIAVIALCIFFGGKNVFNSSNRSGKSSKASNNSDNV